MRKFLFLIAVVAPLFWSCNKAEIEEEDLIGSYWRLASNYIWYRENGKPITMDTANGTLPATLSSTTWYFKSDDKIVVYTAETSAYYKTYACDIDLDKEVMVLTGYGERLVYYIRRINHRELIVERITQINDDPNGIAGERFGRYTPLEGAFDNYTPYE